MEAEKRISHSVKASESARQRRRGTPADPTVPPMHIVPLFISSLLTPCGFQEMKNDDWNKNLEFFFNFNLSLSHDFDFIRIIILKGR